MYKTKKVRAPASLGRLHARLGLSNMFRGNYVTARTNFKQAQTLLKKHDPHWYIQTIKWQGDVDRARGKYQRARTKYLRALSHTHETKHPTHHLRLKALIALVDIHLGKNVSASPLEQSFSHYKNTHSPKFIGVALAGYDLGYAQYMGGDYKQAIRTIQEARMIFEETFGKTHPYIIKYVTLLTRIALKQNEKGEAMRLLLECAPLVTSSQWDIYKDEYYLLKGDLSPPQREDWYKRAYTLAQGMYGTKAPHTQKIQRLLPKS